MSFEGSVISVIDLKRQIVAQTHLNKSSDNFDLQITNFQTGEGLQTELPSQCFFPSRLQYLFTSVYRDEGYLIPKNTSVEVKRVPAAKPTNLRMRRPVMYSSFLLSLVVSSVLLVTIPNKTTGPHEKSSASCLSTPVPFCIPVFWNRKPETGEDTRVNCNAQRTTHGREI